MIVTQSGKWNKGKNNCGFTMVELMIAIVISTIVALSVFAAYSVQSKSFSTQRQIDKLQQDMRGALYMMEYDLLNACRDPNMTNLYNIRDIRYYSPDMATMDSVLAPSPFVMQAPPATNYFASFPVLEFSSLRFDQNPVDGEGDTPMTIRYQVLDINNDGLLDLGRRVAIGQPTAVNVGNPALVAEGVIAIGFAFAVNLNPTGKYEITRTAPAAGGDPLGNVIWAVDTDGDNRLDTNIDITGDGQITLADDLSGDGIINNLDSAAATLPSPADIANAVSVRIWLLLQSERQSPENAIDTNQYVVGDRIVPPNVGGFQDRFKRRVKTVTVALRNYRKS